MKNGTQHGDKINECDILQAVFWYEVLALKIPICKNVSNSGTTSSYKLVCSDGTQYEVKCHLILYETFN